MLGATAVILMLAAAGGVGAFDAEEPRRETVRPIVTSVPAVIAMPYPDPTAAGPVLPSLIMTYFIVGTADERNSLNALKDQLINREWLRKNAMEVVLIEEPEDEARVLALIEQARSASSAAQFIVEDLRKR